ncbi:MAG: hypothetical protein ACO3PV_01390 [Pseudohongiellaceae bacterium]
MPAVQVLIGGALHVCTSLELQQCLPDTDFDVSEPGSEVVALNATRVAGSMHILKSLRDATLSEQRPAPRLTLVTASSANSHAAVDFYLQLFTQLGFDVHWLPVDALLAEILDRGMLCDDLQALRAERLGSAAAAAHPDLLLQQTAFCRDPQSALDLLQSAAAVFFNGGDQSLTLQALLRRDGSDRPWQALIRARHAEGSLIIAGTSAGTAVHSSGEMLMGGDSAAALQHGSLPGDAFLPSAEDVNIPGVLYAAQGSGLFPSGILDSHFSERGRWLRLLTLLRESRASMAFGVDETTALVSEPMADGGRRLRVVGKSGVAILQRAQDGYRMHYLGDGHEVILRDGTLDFADGLAVAAELPEAHLQLDTGALESTAIRDWLQAIFAQTTIPALAHWWLGEQLVLTLDFAAARRLPATSAGSLQGFHNLHLQWP